MIILSWVSITVSERNHLKFEPKSKIDVVNFTGILKMLLTLIQRTCLVTFGEDGERKLSIFRDNDAN